MMMKYNIEHVLYHCLVATFAWNLIKDGIRIMIGCSIKIDVRAALFNFYIIENEMENKKSRLFINTQQ